MLHLSLGWQDEMLKQSFFLTASLFLIIVLFHPGRHAKYYNYVTKTSVINELVANANTKSKSNLTSCRMQFYQQLVLKEIEYSIDKIYKTDNAFEKPLNGGEHIPRECKPIFKTAIVVPYRNRQKHLEMFLNYMHTFLQAQKLYYRIFIVEQNNNLPFNRAKMINVGATEAMATNFSCLIIHDVDLIPLTLGNIYACSKKPRHMSSSVDTFRYNLPYSELSGGALSIQSDHFKKINGMSNAFDGWGGEDDDLFKRLEINNLIPYRFDPEISRYTMLFHNKEKAGVDRWNILSNSLDKQKTDGINSIPSYKVVHKPLYTHIIV